uniref:Uncharacterized protein n=1 Tax=Sphaerodactylus townsendi TaxID=933632 RepID=A0ACB8FXB3_9SAUR
MRGGRGVDVTALPPPILSRFRLASSLTSHVGVAQLGQRLSAAFFRGEGGAKMAAKSYVEETDLGYDCRDLEVHCRSLLVLLTSFIPCLFSH